MATTLPSMQNLSVAWKVPDNNAIIVDLVKSSGLLRTGLVAQSTHGIYHRYKYHNSLPAADFRNMGGGIIPQIVDTDTLRIDLQILDALIQYDYAEIDNYPGGKAGWLVDNFPAYLEGMGQAASKQCFYGTTAHGNNKGFLGLHQYAKLNSNVVAQKGGTTGGNTSIFAVRWDDKDGASLRINRTGNLINTLDLTPSAPKTVVKNTTTNEQLVAYEWLMSAYMALVIPSKKSVGVITQIDASHKPTVTDMNKLVNSIYSPTGRKVIYCNLDGLSYIEDLKDTKLNMFTESNDYDTNVGFWKGIPIVVDENITSVETSVLD